MTVSRFVRPARRLRRLGLVAALLLALGLPTGAMAAAPASGPVVVELAAADDGVLRPDQPLTFTAHATNPTAQIVPTGEVVISFSDAPLTSTEQVRAWLAGTETAESGRQIGAAPIEAMAAYAQRTVAVEIDPDAAGLRSLAPGVYPVWATHDQGSLTATSFSTLVVPGDGTAPVAVVVPVTAPAITTGLLDANVLEDLTDSGGSLRFQLEAAVGTGAILAVDPAIPAAIRALGDDAPAAAQDWLSLLQEMPNSRFALQFGDADIATQIGAGLGAPLQVDAPDALIATGATPTPTPTPTTQTPTVPPAAPTDIGPAPTTVAWPATGTAGSAVAEALAGTGLTMLPSAVVSGSSAARARAGGADLLVYDTDISDALHRASTAVNTVARARALATASAFAAVAGDRPLLVTVDRGADRPGAALRASITTATTLTGHRLVGLEEIAATPAADVTLASVDADPTRVAALTSFLTDETRLAGFATILTDPALLTSRERAAVLQLMGNAWTGDPGFADAVEAHRDATESTLRAVSIVPPSGVTLATSSAALPFTVRNELPWPATLTLTAIPGDPRLIVQTSTEIEAAPQQNSRVEVPVQARVGSGESTLTLQLRSHDQVAIGDAVPVDVSVRAEWETVGVAVMGALVAAMLIIGGIRTVRRLRAGKDTPDDPKHDEATQTEDADG